MAHELHTRSNGFTEMAYVGEKPWHGLGQQLAQDATIEQWAVAAGMDWRVQRSKVRYATDADMATTQQYVTDDDNHVLFRSDSKAKLAIVGADFKLVQPVDTLEFFRDLAADAGFKLCTAGVLQGGRKYWAQAEAGLADNVLGNDVVKGKLLLATACDGSMKTLVKQVTERVVCANTLAMAVGEKGAQVKVSHRSVFDADAVKAQMGIVVHNFETFIANARALACAPVGPNEVDAFLLNLLFAGQEFDTPEQRMAARASTGYSKILNLFQRTARGSDLPGVKGTLWGLLNSVTEYMDHHRGNSGTTRDNRLNYSWFGDGDKLKTAAYKQALALV